ADDKALSKLQWKVEYREVDPPLPGEKGKKPRPVRLTPAAGRASLIMALFQYDPSVPNYQWFAPAYAAVLGNIGKHPVLQPDLKQGKEEFLVRRFAEWYEEFARDLSLDQIDTLLKVNPRNRADVAELLKTRPDIEEYAQKLNIYKEAVVID